MQASTSSSLFPPDPPKKQSQSKCIQVSLSQSTRDKSIQVDICDDPDPYTIEELNKDFPVTKYFPEDIQENLSDIKNCDPYLFEYDIIKSKS